MKAVNYLFRILFITAVSCALLGIEGLRDTYQGRATPATQHAQRTQQ